MDVTANVVVTPADAVVINPEEFRRVIGNAYICDVFLFSLVL